MRTRQCSIVAADLASRPARRVTQCTNALNFALLLAAGIPGLTSTPSCVEGDDEQDGLAPLVALLYEQGVQTPCLDSDHGSRWGDYLLQVACRIQELRRIHPPNGALQAPCLVVCVLAHNVDSSTLRAREMQLSRWGLEVGVYGDRVCVCNQGGDATLT